MVCGKSVNVPINAIRKSNNKYDEITIPAGDRTDVKQVTLVKVNELDSIGKMVFKDIEVFNLIQSEVFPTVYHTNENMLICAPTGAGKTNVALLAIVHQIKNFIEEQTVHLDKFKVR